MKSSGLPTSASSVAHNTQAHSSTAIQERLAGKDPVPDHINLIDQINETCAAYAVISVSEQPAAELDASKLKEIIKRHANFLSRELSQNSNLVDDIKSYYHLGLGLIQSFQENMDEAAENFFKAMEYDPQGKNAALAVKQELIVLTISASRNFSQTTIDIDAQVVDSCYIFHKLISSKAIDLHFLEKAYQSSLLAHYLQQHSPYFVDAKENNLLTALLFELRSDLKTCLATKNISELSSRINVTTAKIFDLLGICFELKAAMAELNAGRAIKGKAGEKHLKKALQHAVDAKKAIKSPMDLAFATYIETMVFSLLTPQDKYESLAMAVFLKFVDTTKGQALLSYLRGEYLEDFMVEADNFLNDCLSQGATAEIEKQISENPYDLNARLARLFRRVHSGSANHSPQEIKYFILELELLFWLQESDIPNPLPVVELKDKREIMKGHALHLELKEKLKVKKNAPSKKMDAVVLQAESSSSSSSYSINPLSSPDSSASILPFTSPDVGEVPVTSSTLAVPILGTEEHPTIAQTSSSSSQEELTNGIKSLKGFEGMPILGRIHLDEEVREILDSLQNLGYLHSFVTGGYVRKKLMPGREVYSKADIDIITAGDPARVAEMLAKNKEITKLKTRTQNLFAFDYKGQQFEIWCSKHLAEEQTRAALDKDRDERDLNINSNYADINGHVFNGKDEELCFKEIESVNSEEAASRLENNPCLILRAVYFNHVLNCNQESKIPLSKNLLLGIKRAGEEGIKLTDSNIHSLKSNFFKILNHKDASTLLSELYKAKILQALFPDFSCLPGDEIINAFLSMKAEMPIESVYNNLILQATRRTLQQNFMQGAKIANFLSYLRNSSDLSQVENDKEAIRATLSDLKGRTIDLAKNCCKNPMISTLKSFSEKDLIEQVEMIFDQDAIVNELKNKLKFLSSFSEHKKSQNAKAENLNTLVTNLHRANQSLVQDNNNKTKEIEGIKYQLNPALYQIDILRNENNSLKHKMAGLEYHQATLTGSVEGLQRDVMAHQQAYSQSQAENLSLRNELEHYKQTYSQSETENVSLKNELEQYKRAYQDTMAKLEGLKTQVFKNQQPKQISYHSSQQPRPVYGQSGQMSMTSSSSSSTGRFFSSQSGANVQNNVQYPQQHGGSGYPSSSNYNKNNPYNS